VFDFFLNVTIIHNEIGKKEIRKVKKNSGEIRKGGEAFKKD